MDTVPLLVTGDDNDASAASAAPTLTVAPAAPSPSPPPRPARRRGHRAQSGVWRFLTADANPHHAISSQCMHCQHVVPHHRKNEKARAHLKRCAVFRKKMAELPPEERPAWVDLTARVRGGGNHYATRLTSSHASTHSASSVLPLTPSPVTMDASSLGTVVSDVEMLDESLITSIQPTPASATANDGDGSAHDGHAGQADQDQHEGSGHHQLAEQTTLVIDHNDMRGDTATFHSGMGIQSVQDAVAMHAYMTGVSIESLAEANLVTAFRLANSTVVLPAPDKICGILLDRAYQRVREKVDADMRLSEYNAISSNGWWTDDNRRYSERPKLASTAMREAKYMAANEVQTFYMGASHASEAEWQDPEFLSSEVVRIMEHCLQRISGAVTDCTPAHQVAWQKLKAIYPSKFFQGCASHGLRLLIQDIFASSASATTPPSTAVMATSIDLSSDAVGSIASSDAAPVVDSPSPLMRLQELVQNCRLIVDCFNRENALRAQMQQAMETEGQHLEFPPEDRQWDKLQASFRSILSAVPVLRKVVSDPSFVNDAPVYFRSFRAHVMQVVLDADFVALLEKAVALLEPLSAALARFEQRDVPCSEVFACFAKTLPDAFGKLGPLLSEDERSHLLLLNQKRFNSMYGDGHGVAYLLDPRYLGDGLSIEVRKNIEDIIYAFPVTSGDGEAMDESMREDAQLEMAQQLTEFIIDATRERTNRTFRFSMLARNKKSVLQYWLTDGQRWPRLQRLACRVFCLPSSTLRLDRHAASLAGTGPHSSAASTESAANTTETTRIEDKIQFIRINTLLLGDIGLGGITC